MFDQLHWYEVVGLLAPLVLAMWWIRNREVAAVSTRYKQLTQAQKGWVLLMLLPPGTSSRLMGAMKEDFREGYVEAGSSIRGSGRNLIAPVVAFARANLPPEIKKQVGTNTEENIARLARWADTEPTQFLAWLRQHFPLTQTAPPPGQLVTSAT